MRVSELFLTVKDCFMLIGSVSNIVQNDLIQAVRSVPRKIFFDEEGRPLKKEVPLDEKIAESLEGKGWKIQRNYRLLKESRFTVDLASEKRKILIEIEKGQLPRLELDIIKMMSASKINSSWLFGTLIVPATYIKMKLAPNTIPFDYLKNLKPLIGYMQTSLKGLVVIGYEDPRSQ